MKDAAANIIPQFPINQYLVITRPSDTLLERMKRIQRIWTEESKLTGNQLQSGYLLLSRFSQFATLENKTLRKLHYAAMGCAPYKINLEGFFGTPSHSLGLRISNPVPVKTINKALQQQLNEMKFPVERPYYNQFAAIGLASKLQPAQYNMLWKKYEHRHFAAGFVADHLMVLRKTQGSSKWTLLEKFVFENIPVQVKQGKLFA